MGNQGLPNMQGVRTGVRAAGLPTRRQSVGRSRSRPPDPSQGRPRLALFTVGILALASMTGCSSGHTSTVGKAQSSTTTTADPKQQVLTAWAAAQQAIADAELHSDPNWPALFQTMVNPELAHVQAVIRIAQQQGYHAKGSFRIIHSEVTFYSSTRATVQGCVWGGVIAYQANDEPVPGNAGKATYGIEQGVMVPAGSSWALQDGTAHQFDTAQQAGSLCAG